MRSSKIAAGVAALVTTLALPAQFAGAATMTGGHVRVWATPSPAGNGGTVMITGAVADYGRTINTNKAGVPTSSGYYAKLILHKGTFRVNAVAFNLKVNKSQPSFDAASCSAWLSVSGPVTLFGGTGDYANISGTVDITEAVAFVFPRYAAGKDKGQCNTNAQPLSTWASLTGTGTVDFS
ncbi:MAG TPA: hypothetical protein VME20_01935 [Acidimicrobiales bacterium]|nr:hypothetical protein [Acidimicrobiales bacterium]